MNDPIVGRLAFAAETCRSEHVEHRPVLKECVGREERDPVVRGVGGKILKEKGCDAAPLVVIRHCEGDLGLGPTPETVIATDPNDRLTEKCHKGHAVVVVNRGEPCDLCVTQFEFRSEEPEVHAVLGLSSEEGAMGRRILGANRPHVNRSPVGQHRIDRPRGRIDAGPCFAWRLSLHRERAPPRAASSSLQMATMWLMDGSRTRVDVLGREECLRLLAFKSYVGRVGFLSDGQLYVLPVNYLAENDAIFFCTAEGTKLSAL
ncbi:MAG TPA: pyridoxamine 5'-phosphate oxidase family protein, partial [Mycobacterium sp.]|nr:pyridoxamine 5'-phosphate oxidase family protein [Mycobacterium sp.]